MNTAARRLLTAGSLRQPDLTDEKGNPMLKLAARYLLIATVLLGGCSMNTSGTSTGGGSGGARGTVGSGGARGTVGSGSGGAATGGPGNGSGHSGGQTGTIIGAGSGVVCPLGSLGCGCDPQGGCAPAFSCKAGICCDTATGNCTAPTTPIPGATAGGVHADGGMAACNPGVSGPVTLSSCGYPYSSSNPLTNVDFNESEVLRAIVPSGGYPMATIQVFYNDEHALNLGVRSVTVNGVTTNYPVSPLTASPSSVLYPQTGATALTGDQAGIDGAGRPMWPVLYITDITDDPNSTAGDWQQGGKPWNPNVVFGSWKSSVRSGGVVTTDKADPKSNGWNLSAGGGPVPSGLTDEGFGAEVRWYLALIPGHAYRIQTMVHDGDSKNGGDVGEACVNFCASACNNIEGGCGPAGGPDGGTPPPPSCPAGQMACVQTGIDPTACPTGTICSNGCCVPGIL